MSTVTSITIAACSPWRATTWKRRFVPSSPAASSSSTSPVHHGVHPRLGVADVVPFVPLDRNGTPRAGDDLGPALSARARFGTWAAQTLGLPCFYYGPERSLPDVRRHAFTTFLPDAGPLERQPPLRGVCRGGPPRPHCLQRVARDAPMSLSPRRWPQRSCEPDGAHARAGGGRSRRRSRATCSIHGPSDRRTYSTRWFSCGGQPPPACSRAELVGLAPAAVVRSTPAHRWAELDLDPDRTIEARLLGARGAATVPQEADAPAATRRLMARARRNRRRSRSERPPQMPNFSPLAKAYSRQSSRTTHPRHTSLASRVDAPRSGKKRSGSTPMQFARFCQSRSWRPYNSETTFTGPPPLAT